MVNPHGGQFPIGRTLGLIDGTPDQTFTWSYVYSRDREWIDMGHFLSMARIGAKYPERRVEAIVASLLYEEFSRQAGNLFPEWPGMGSSAYTPEDMKSNGMGFAFAFGSKLVSNIPLSEQLRKFFDDINATDPSFAWNYELLPRDEEVWETAWRNYPELATKKCGIIMNPNHPIWTTYRPSSPEIASRINEIWEPLLVEPVKKERK